MKLFGDLDDAGVPRGLGSMGRYGDTYGFQTSVPCRVSLLRFRLEDECSTGVHELVGVWVGCRASFARRVKWGLCCLGEAWDSGSGSGCADAEWDSLWLSVPACEP